MGYFLFLFNFLKGIFYISSFLLFIEVINWLICESLVENVGGGNLREKDGELYGKIY